VCFLCSHLNGLSHSFIYSTHTKLTNITWNSLPFHYFSWIFFSTVTRRVPLEEQKLVTLTEHFSSPSVLFWVRLAQSSVFCLVFCRPLFIFLKFRLWLLLWYVQSFLISILSSLPSKIDTSKKDVSTNSNSSGIKLIYLM
jgi:hypothetical protein